MSPLTQVTLASLAEGAAVEQVNYLLSSQNPKHSEHK